MQTTQATGLPPVADFPRPHVVGPNSAHHYTIIFLHGRGSSGEEFAEDLLNGNTSNGTTLLEQRSLENCKWVFPQAHERMSTIFREELTEWFDIYSLSDPDAEEHLQIDGLRESIRHVHDIIHEELQYVPPSNIILGGISQGFAVASHVLLSSSHQLCGFFGFSGWIALQHHLQDATKDPENLLPKIYSKVLGMKPPTHTKALGTPISISHSSDDPTVDISHGSRACKLLRDLGMSVEFKTFDEGEH